MTTLEEAKEVILKYIDDSTVVKNSKWVYDKALDIYIEVDAGYSEEDMELFRGLKYRDMRDWFKLRELIEDLI